MANNTPMAQPTAAQPAMNTLSVVSFVISLLGFNVIAIILGAVSLSQIKKTGERGRGFALAAVWIGVISIVLLTIILIFAVITAAQNAS